MAESFHDTRTAGVTACAEDVSLQGLEQKPDADPVHVLATVAQAGTQLRGVSSRVLPCDSVAAAVAATGSVALAASRRLCTESRRMVQPHGGC